ncbi:hypothetical protein [Cetobacterium sp. 2G large]|uniref:hypothetical protein n=1 Tax=Cetobacterium sp. 2G large TaxID=2759680 RepID=UPI00163CDF35|nr:hypothetical protein [Cetobacterium sp. 2G large]MBC2853467.1 hypothetical protein [Cetobacterium sp. 2G large]
MDEKLFLLIDFINKKYNVKIYLNNNKKNKLGVYLKYIQNKNEKFELIKLCKKKLLESSYELNLSLDILTFFVLFHEIGHMLIEKSKIIQNEEYASYIAIKLLSQLNICTQNEMNEISNYFNNFEVISEKRKCELEVLAELFSYSLKKEKIIAL